MAKPTQGYLKQDERNFWNQDSRDVGNAGDKETLRIFDQMTGSGLVQTEDGKKNGGNDRKNKKYSS